MTDTVEPPARRRRSREEPLRAGPAPSGPSVELERGPESERFRLGFRPALDGLRGVSVIAIMLFHTVTYLLPVEHQDLMLGTFLSVDIFFLLSGFLLTSLLRSEEHTYELPSIM